MLMPLDDSFSKPDYCNICGKKTPNMIYFDLGEYYKTRTFIYRYTKCLKCRSIRVDTPEDTITDWWASNKD